MIKVYILAILESIIVLIRLCWVYDGFGKVIVRVFISLLYLGNSLLVLVDYLVFIFVFFGFLEF